VPPLDSTRLGIQVYRDSFYLSGLIVAKKVNKWISQTLLVANRFQACSKVLYVPHVCIHHCVGALFMTPINRYRISNMTIFRSSCREIRDSIG
jgi:hypothetical protein